MKTVQRSFLIFNESNYPDICIVLKELPDQRIKKILTLLN